MGRMGIADRGVAGRRSAGVRCGSLDNGDLPAGGWSPRLRHRRLPGRAAGHREESVAGWVAAPDVSIKGAFAQRSRLVVPVGDYQTVVGDPAVGD